MIHTVRGTAVSLVCDAHTPFVRARQFVCHTRQFHGPSCFAGAVLRGYAGAISCTYRRKAAAARAAAARRTAAAVIEFFGTGE